MKGLYDAGLGPRAVIRESAHGRLRRVRHGDTSMEIDTARELSLVMNVTASHRVERRMDGTARSETPQVGSITVIPPGHRLRFTITGECHILQFRLPWPETARDLAGRHGLDAKAIAMPPWFNLADPLLAKLCCKAAAVERDADADAAVRGIADYLFTRRFVRRPAAPRTGGIAPARLRRVLDLIDADVRRGLPIAMLAGEAGLSPFHFAREFARTTGQSPHRYVVRRRVEQAIQLLARSPMTVGQVAAETGFAHASHLARQMHAVVGLTPEAFRAHVLP